MENRSKKQTATQVVKEIKRRTRRKFTAEEKIKIVLEAMRGEDTIAAICRKYAIHSNNYFNWSKDFMEAGKRRLAGNIKREATTSEVHQLKNENMDLKQLVAELSL
ncbi:MAG TPA: transposase, partial [Bacteroidales bacterium]|nr:transposase [Bacteroidales bacterium]